MRDLEADLAICEAATPGPWGDRHDAVHAIVPNHLSQLIWICQLYEGPDTHPIEFQNQDANAAFIAAARTGWPEAIRRAIAAEDRVDKLENELRMLHDIINSNKA